MNDEYLSLTLLSLPGETEADFKRRLSGFWTHMLRNRPDDYEKVYAETAAFERHGEGLSRKYLIEAGVSDLLTRELRAQKLEFLPVDEDDVYSKYEATPPEWFWIEH
jgi:hypothetical protein